MSNMNHTARALASDYIAEARQILAKTDDFSDRGYLVRLHVAQVLRLLDDIEAVLPKEEEAKVPA